MADTHSSIAPVEDVEACALSIIRPMRGAKILLGVGFVTIEATTPAEAVKLGLRLRALQRADEVLGEQMA